jgi:predicted Zn finger-like uncharacterized protein
MQISCPNCNAIGSISDHEIPEEGRFLSCPRCMQTFTVNKPRAEVDDYLVETCPACGFNTFVEEYFATCPKCGVVAKTYIQRQREEDVLAREHELVNRKFSRVYDVPIPGIKISPVVKFADNLHPVVLIGQGCALAALIILGMGVWGLWQYHPDKIQEQLLDQLDEPVSALFVFAHYGLMPWIKTLYGGAALISALFFIRQRKVALKLLSWVLRAALVFIPVYQVIGFINWVLEPISHSVLGYLVEIINILFMTALWGVPILLLDRFLKDKKVTSIVKL